jgi:membrane protease YdiL (CAAX protease family)
MSVWGARRSHRGRNKLQVDRFLVASKPEKEPKVTALRLKTAAIVYGALAAAAVGLGFYRGSPDIFHHPDALMAETFPLGGRILLGGGAGVAFGLGSAWISRYSVYRFQWARDLHVEFRGIFGPLTGGEVLAYAALSAVAEEMFFRGAVQPLLGVLLTSVVFAALHVGRERKFIPWTLQAFAMGLAFGGLYWLTGDLTAPVMAHFTINYQNLHFINSYDPPPTAPEVSRPEEKRPKIDPRP